MSFQCIHGFSLLPQFKNMHVRTTGDSKLTLSVMVACLISLCVGPVMDWRSVVAVLCLTSDGSWDRFQSPTTLNWIK